MKRDYSKDIADAILSCFKNNGFKGYHFDEEKGVIRFHVSVESRINDFLYVIRIYESGYIVHTLLPLSATEDVMNQMSWFEGYANCELPYGNFELDPEDGEISFKYPITCIGGVIPPEEMIMESIVIPFETLKRYTPGILAVCFAGMDGQEACYKCEGRDIEPASLEEDTTDTILELLNNGSGSSDGCE